MRLRVHAADSYRGVLQDTPAGLASSSARPAGRPAPGGRAVADLPSAPAVDVLQAVEQTLSEALPQCDEGRPRPGVPERASGAIWKFWLLLDRDEQVRRAFDQIAELAKREPNSPLFACSIRNVPLARELMSWLRDGDPLPDHPAVIEHAKAKGVEWLSPPVKTEEELTDHLRGLAFTMLYVPPILAAVTAIREALTAAPAIGAEEADGADERLTAIAAFASASLKGKSRRITDLIVANGGCVAIETVARDPAVQWQTPYDDCVQSYRKRVNPRLTDATGIEVVRRDNELRFERSAPQSRPKKNATAKKRRADGARPKKRRRAI